MTPKEHPAKKPSPTTGIFATLCAHLGFKGTRALSPGRTRLVLPVPVGVLTLFALSALTLTATPALAAAPTVISETSTGVKATEARVEAVVNPSSEVTECHFQYGALSVSEHEVPCETPLIEGSEQGVGVTLTGLTGHTIYGYRVLLKNLKAEEAIGEEKTFETAITPEVPVTEPPETGSVTGNTATLRGELNPASTATNGYHFAYNTNGECTGASTSAPGTEEEATKRKVSTPVTGLEPLREYTVCVVSTNAAGEETLGNAVKFNTPAAPPIVDAESASNIKSSEATFEGTVNPNNQLTECHFQYGIGAVSENTVPCSPETLKGFGEDSVGPKNGEGNPQPTGGLTAGSEYKYRILTKNGTGEEAAGPENHFRTAEEPEKQPAEPVTATTATLKGVLNPHHPFEAGTYEFTYEASASECTGPAGPHGELPFKTVPVPAAASTEASPQPVSAELTALQPGATYTYCLLQRNAASEQAAIGAPETFTTPSAAPAIEGEFASSIQETAATLNAQIDPDGAETSYHFEYGTSESYGQSTPVTKLEGPLTQTDTAAASLTGLAPSTTYHYRVSATNEVAGKTETTTGEDKTFTTPSATGEPAGACPNEKLRGEQPYGLKLPDCRAYEQVSPLNTEGQDATDKFVTNESRAAESGEALTYASKGSFANPVGATYTDQFLSRRGPGGWTTQDITLPHEAYATDVYHDYPSLAFTPELSAGVGGTRGSAPGTEAPPGLAELYLLRFQPLTYQWLSDVPNRETPYATETEGSAAQGASTDLSHVVFVSVGDNSELISEWVDGTVFTVNVTNTGELIPGAVGTVAPSTVVTDGGVGDLWHAVSATGKRVFFKSSAGSALYVRENPEAPQSELGAKGECLQPERACTVEISSGPATYLGASASGALVFYLKDENLYEYDVAAATTIPIAQGAQVQGILTLSEEGGYVYFVADGALGGGAIAGKPNLYVSHDAGAPRFIATLAAGDERDWRNHVGSFPESNSAVLSPDGTHLAFLSEQPLTGYDNEQASHGQCEGEIESRQDTYETGRCMEIFSYDAFATTLTCASCNPTGARPMGPSSFGVITYSSEAVYRPRHFSDAGALFFDSSDALVPHASDGLGNVYEYSHGQIHALSDVAGGFESFFLDASANGANVFFATATQLLPEDRSNNVAVWDARVNGGFSVAVQAQPCQNGDSCKQPPAAQPGTFGPPASATFSGPGNLKPSPPPPPNPKTAAQLRAEKLAKALKACRKKHNKHKRQVCEKGAHKAYGAKASAKKSAKRATTNRRASR